MMKKSLLLIVVVMLSGCSIKMAYNNLDRMIKWGVSDYVDLNSAQEDVLEQELERIHTWHRRNHLPQYAQLMRTLAQQSVDEISPARMREVSDQFEFWFDEMEEKFTPLIIEIMVSLTDEQMVALPEKMKTSNAEWAEAEAEKSVAESQKEWAEGLEGIMKNFTGRLNSDQKAYIARRSLEYRPERVMWADYRARFQDDLFALLQNRKSAEFPAAYRELIAVRDSYWGDELKEVFEHNENLNMDVTSHVLSNLTPKQSQRLVDSLTDLSEDLDDLSQQT